MELFDVVDEAGEPTGEIVEREEAHEKGIRHRTSHLWLVRKKNGILQVLLQKRSMSLLGWNLQRSMHQKY